MTIWKDNRIKLLFMQKEDTHRHFPKQYEIMRSYQTKSSHKIFYVHILIISSSVNAYGQTKLKKTFSSQNNANYWQGCIIALVDCIVDRKMLIHTNNFCYSCNKNSSSQVSDDRVDSIAVMSLVTLRLLYRFRIYILVLTNYRLFCHLKFLRFLFFNNANIWSYSFEYVQYHCFSMYYSFRYQQFNIFCIINPSTKKKPTLNQVFFFLSYHKNLVNKTYLKHTKILFSQCVNYAKKRCIKKCSLRKMLQKTKDSLSSFLYIAYCLAFTKNISQRTKLLFHRGTDDRMLKILLFFIPFFFHIKY